MTAAVLLLTSVPITHTEFSAFLQQSGAVLTPDDWSDGRLSRGHQHVWILRNPPDVHYEPDNLKRITQKLGGPPQTYIVLDLSSEEGTQRLAMELVLRFAERWPVVVDNLLSGHENRLFSPEEVVALYKSGGGFY